MLEDCLIESRPSVRVRKPLTVMLSTIVHAVIAAGLLLLPLIQTQALPRLDAMFLLRPPESPVKESPAASQPVAPVIQRQIILDQSEFIAPTQIPREIAAGIDAAPMDNATPVVPRASAVRNLLESVGQSNPQIAEPAPPPPPPVQETPAPKILRVSAGLQSGNLIYQPKPVYPPLARQARVQGIVVLEATITVDGAIQNLRVVSGHPLLTSAAIDGVKQWRYRPTLLSGEPVQVITTITVTFSLQ